MYSSFCFVFFIMYVISFVFVISFDDWFLIWMGMEINMISFIFIIYYSLSMINVESCVKYFFIQSVGSGIFLSLFYLNKAMFLCYGSVMLSMKMGGGLFYFWFPLVCMGISWMSCFLLMSFQKVIPLMLMMNFNSWMLLFMMFVSLMVGVFLSFNNVNMKLLMAYSSIHQIGWLMMCVIVENNLWMIYLMTYVVVLLPMLMIFGFYEVNNMMMIGSMKEKWLIIFLLINMGGIPPLLGFFLKWMGFYYFLLVNWFIIMMMVFLSSIMFYVYMRVSFNVMMGEVYYTLIPNISYKKYLFNNEMFIFLGILVGNIILMMMIS